jgi:hypothetical protein
MAKFQAWVEARFPFSRGIPWHRTFLCLCLGSSARSLQTGFEHFDLFLRGEAPDCPSPTAATIMETTGVSAETAKEVAPI